MWSAYQVAVSGAQAQERALEVISNNLANTQTPGFKARRASLAEQPPGASVFSIPTQGGGLTLSNGNVGQGVALSAILSNGSDGTPQGTGRALDIAIAGEGFIELRLPDGRSGYTRAGSLHLDPGGRLVGVGGALVSSDVQIPSGASQIRIAPDGVVAASVNGTARQVGKLDLVRFRNPEALESVGQGVFVSTQVSGDPVRGNPGVNGFGALVAQALEASNVDVADEFTRMLQAQRAYSVNLRAVQTIDQMLQAANALRA